MAKVKGMSQSSPFLFDFVDANNVLLVHFAGYGK